MTMGTESVVLDQARVEAFMGKIVEDFSGTMTTLLCVLGDRLGLFGALAQRGPTTAAELAQRAGVSERYALEWLSGLAAAEYLGYDPTRGRYALPPEHQPAFAQEAGPMFLCGGYQMVHGMLKPFDRLVAAFRDGGGVSQEEFPDEWWDGMQRFTASWFENLLLDEWLPALPHVTEKLQRGALVADVGCGSGRAVLKLAEAFPKSRFVGFDAFEGQIARATRNAEHAGVPDRVGFKLLDVAQGIPGEYDLITTFDVIHDAVDPLGIIEAIRGALKREGSYLLLEINCQDHREDNVGPIAALFYGFSVFYCMTTSLAHGGEGLGTCGCPEAKVRELCGQAGFGQVERVAVENPFNVLYEIRP
jgi:2-polyprenyl-3-methyl-5-hydroxy-6-metoxy-1,4-benzoquinol methylase